MFLQHFETAKGPQEGGTNWESVKEGHVLEVVAISHVVEDAVLQHLLAECNCAFPCGGEAMGDHPRDRLTPCKESQSESSCSISREANTPTNTDRYLRRLCERSLMATPFSPRMHCPRSSHYHTTSIRHLSPYPTHHTHHFVVLLPRTSHKGDEPPPTPPEKKRMGKLI